MVVCLFIRFKFVLLFCFQSWKVQTIEVTKDVNGVGFKLVMKEVNNLRGIPYSDYFSVLTEWVVVALPAATGASASCKVSIFLDFEFHKYTWLQGTIESNTKAELIEMYELWLQSAQESLRRALDRKMSTLSTLHALRENLKGSCICFLTCVAIFTFFFCC